VGRTGAVVVRRARLGFADRFRGYSVVINDVKSGKIGNGETRWFEMPTGQHSLRLKLDRRKGSKTIKFSCEPNQTTTFECRPGAGNNLLGALRLALKHPDEYIELHQSWTPKGGIVSP
jgi:hypothetical protein